MDYPPSVKRILIVDDNDDVARSIVYWLKNTGYEVRSAPGTAEALALVGNFTVDSSFAEPFHPDVVLLDIGLPFQDGFYLARELRKMPDMQRALLIAMTGHSRDEDQQRSHEAGIDHHMVKPLDHAKFLRLINEHLG